MTSTEKLVELLRATLPMKAVGRGRHGDTIVEVDLTAIEHQRHEAADALEAKDARIAELEAELEWFQSRCAERKDQLLSLQYGPGAASTRGREDQR